MKNLLIFSSVFMFLGCITAPPYTPEHLFPQGSVYIKPVLNKDFTTPLHKFIEIHFFNDSKEWVEIQSFAVSLEDGVNAKILTDQRQIEEWSFLRSEEVVRNTSESQAQMSSLFSLFGLGLAIVELGTDSDTFLSDVAFDTANAFDYASSVSKDLKWQKLTSDLNNGQLAKSLRLAPGRTTKRWFVVNTPDLVVPNSLLVSYNAQGSISGNEKKYNIEFNVN